jgi:hypothetical protein
MELVQKFADRGIDVEKEEVFSAAFAAAAYLKTLALPGKVGRCRLTVPEPVLKAPMVSALEAPI